MIKNYNTQDNKHIIINICNTTIELFKIKGYAYIKINKHILAIKNTNIHITKQNDILNKIYSHKQYIITHEKYMP